MKNKELFTKQFSKAVAQIFLPMLVCGKRWKKLVNAPILTGSYDTKLDDKSRFVLPQVFRYALVEEGKLEFWIGFGLGGCLAIYRKSEIEKIAQKFREKQHIAKYKKFFTFFFSTLHQTTCDKIGRVTLPAKLKAAAKIHKEMVLAGVLDKIEIWPKDAYDNSLAELLSGEKMNESLESLTEEAFSLLQENNDELA